MKFFRYKEVARLNFVGTDDELINVDSSYYNTKFKLFNNTIVADYIISKTLDQKPKFKYCWDR